jgi:hypothetical protein
VPPLARGGTRCPSLVTNYSAWPNVEGRRLQVHPHCRQNGQIEVQPPPTPRPPARPSSPRVSLAKLRALQLAPHAAALPDKREEDAQRKAPRQRRKSRRLRLAARLTGPVLMGWCDDAEMRKSRSHVGHETSAVPGPGDMAEYRRPARMAVFGPVEHDAVDEPAVGDSQGRGQNTARNKAHTRQT